MDNRIKEKMKKGLAMVMTICMVLTMVGIVPEKVKAAYNADNYDASSGDGSEESKAIVINGKDQLLQFASDVKAGAFSDSEKFFKLKAESGNTIDLSGANWEPIANFKGTFAGGGVTIVGMSIEANGTGSYGLFGQVSSGSKIENIKIKDSTITVTGSGTSKVGMLMGSGTNVTVEKCETLENCEIKYESGVAENYFGGLVGSNTGASSNISSCTNKTKITDGTTASNAFSGGIVGEAVGTIDKCVNRGIVTGKNVGGIVGKATSILVKNKCWNYADLTGSVVVGGIVGVCGTGTVDDCTNEGSVTSGNVSTATIGGIVATKSSEGTISNCTNKKDILQDESSKNVGGIVGEKNGSTEIINCTNEGSIKGAENVGGVVALVNGSGAVTGCINEGDVTSKNSGSITANKYAGGIIARDEGTGAISGCTNTGNIEADTTAGGIIGWKKGKAKITGCKNNGNRTQTQGAVTGDIAGGIVGNFADAEEIKDCHNTGKIKGETAVGGIAGLAELSEIKVCSNTGDISVGVKTEPSVGGIVAEGNHVEESFNSGTVTGRNAEAKDTPKCGGIAGFIKEGDGEILYCKNSGRVKFGAGICGKIAPYIKDCYNEGITDFGGIANKLGRYNITHCYSAEVGYREDSEPLDVDLVKLDGREGAVNPNTATSTLGEPVNCFYWNLDEHPTGQSGGQNDPSTKKWKNWTVKPLKAREFSNQDTFVKAGWDFTNVWKMASVGSDEPKIRPILGWENKDKPYVKGDVTAELIMLDWTQGGAASSPKLVGSYDKAKHESIWEAEYLLYYRKNDDGTFTAYGKGVKAQEPGEYKLVLKLPATDNYNAATLTTYYTIFPDPDAGKDPEMKPIAVAIEQANCYEGEEVPDPKILGEKISNWQKTKGYSVMYKRYVSDVTDVWDNKGYTDKKPTAVDTYVERIVISEDKNAHYAGDTFYQIFEIKSRQAGTVSSGRKVPNIYIDMPTAWYYGQTPQRPILKGDYDHSAIVTWNYTDLRNNYSTNSMPVNAGTYKVEVRLSETANYVAASSEKIFNIFGYGDYYGVGNTAATVGYALPISNQSVTKVSSSVMGNMVEVATVSESTLNSISGTNSSYNSVLLDASGASTRVNRMSIDRSSLNEIYRLMDRKTHINNAVIRFTRGDLELTKTRLAKLLSENTGLKFEFSLSEDGTSNLTRSQQSALTMGGILGILEPRLRRVNENGSIKTYDSLNGKDMKVRYSYTMPTGKTIADYEVYGVGTNGSLRQYPLTYQNGQFLFDVQTEDVYVLVLKGATSGTTTIDPTIIEGGGIIEAASSSLALNAEFVVRHRGRSLKVGWGKVGNADCYEIYASRTNRDFDYSKPTKVVSGNKENSLLLTQVGGKHVNAKTNYKVCVYACKLVDGQRVKVFQSLIGYVVGTQNKKYTNTRIMTVRQTHCFMEVGDTNKMGAKVYLMDKKKKLVPGYTSKFRYCSSNPEIVSVSKSGKLTAVSPGTCVVYVYAKNGVARKTTVKVS
ncbi:MAG: hypothetical protein E7280_07010 [Lachnospiraceae bacterium]|jgi:hypothetical protein|nr:hypothetical protein [Lachnospiraceae bacterium]